MQFSKNMLFSYKIAPNCVKLILLVSRNYHYASTSHHSLSSLSIDFLRKISALSVYPNFISLSILTLRVNLSKLNNVGDQSVDLV